MPNVGLVLKGEIARLARKEARTEVAGLKKSSALYRKEIAELKRRIGRLESVSKRASKVESAETSSPMPDRLRFSAKGLQSLRKRLGLSAADFGQLAGVSGQSVYLWEQGKSVPRKSLLPKLADLRKLGKKEARSRLDASPRAR